MSLANRTIDLASKQVLVAADGTAAAPSITNDGDTNTGMFFPAADTIAFSEGGTESMRIDSSGNVGIGVVTPISSLHIKNATPVSKITLEDSSTNRIGQIAGGSDGSGGYLAFSAGNNGGSIFERLRIDSSGNVILTGNKSLISRGAGGVSTNSAIGDGALQANTTGYQNTANGYAALYSNTTGNNNTVNGYAALYSNTTGQNTANGGYALYSNTTGNNNTANGLDALYSNTTGNINTAIGFQAGYGAAGTNANTTGSNNTFIGNEAVGSSGTASNVITLGNSAITTLRCQVTTITALSDRRDKKDIVSLAGGLDLINALNPVSFVWNMRDGKKVGIPEIGFIAQELEEAQKQSGLTVPNLVYADNPERLEASPATLIPILVKAVQELSEEVNQLKAKLKE